MLKGRGRDPREAVPPTPTFSHNPRQQAFSHSTPTRPTHTPHMQRAPFAKPEPDYEVVEFPSEQYVNAKLQPPPPPPPRPSTGHPAEAGASCGLCGGGGARVRCSECNRRALCASCDDMYHRHPKRRNHQRQAISLAQMRDERPPLPPKTSAPVPPPRRHKMSASPRPPSTDLRRATLDHTATLSHMQPLSPNINHTRPTHQQIPQHLQAKLSTTPSPNHIGSVPYLPSGMHTTPTIAPQFQGHHTLSHVNQGWNRQRGSLQGFNYQQAPLPDSWCSEALPQTGQAWGRPLRKGASVLELRGGTVPCSGCAQCSPHGWRYGSCANLEHPWQNVWQPPCCGAPQPIPQVSPHESHHHSHSHLNPHTPQPHRRAYVDSRTVSRAASRAGSRAASPAMSVRSRTSRRNKHRTPSPPPLPSSDADSESDSESDHPPENNNIDNDDSLGPPPPPSSASWQCEHCTFVNEPGVRVCSVCCRTPTVAPKAIASDVSEEFKKIKIIREKSIPKDSGYLEEDKINDRVRSNSKPKKERSSTGCGPSPPREPKAPKATTNRLVTPVREYKENDRTEITEKQHDMAVGSSPPPEIRSKQSTGCGPSPPRTTDSKLSSMSQDDKHFNEPVKVHSISVGPSPPREVISNSQVSKQVSSTSPIKSLPKKSTGTSPPRNTTSEIKSSNTRSIKTTVSNTGTSPPPQSISTQTYETPSTWERSPSSSRSRPRRRFRDDARRERSHSRHSLSSDTRDSDLSARTVGANGKWEWRDKSPGTEWGDNSRISRRASHLDLRRTQPHRRSGFYGSEAASPEPGSIRAGSVEALSGSGGRRDTDRGLELARLMAEAERLGFSAAEVQAALTQSPAAPLAWLRSRWPSLCAGVRAAAARLASDVTISELEARAALARHRGAMWPAVTECIERHRRQADTVEVSEEGRLRGRVWGSPAGADDDAAPKGVSHHSSRVRAEDSSDENEGPLLPTFRNDDWMYLPLDVNVDYARETDLNPNLRSGFAYDVPQDSTENIALRKNNITEIDENLLQDLVEDINLLNLGDSVDDYNAKLNTFELIQTENDFIDAYNALAKSNPLPNIRSHESHIDSKINSSLSENQMHQSRKNIELNRNYNSNLDMPNVNTLSTTINDKHGTTKIQKNSKKSPGNFSNNNISNVQSLNVNKSLSNGTSLDNNYYIATKAKQNKNLEKKIGEQPDERTKNLNDIVDNTQKLIQQMKEEINSDINSLDSRNISQSENDSSSNDEQESSYSNTESGTDLESDGNETSSTENEELRQSEAQRTSSEENEQFEEALDNLDSQVESFKQVNIEILDSIARSLQEDHTLTMEPKEADHTFKKHDANNNIFKAVNSFEEIYEQLNAPRNTANINNQQEINLLATNNTSEDVSNSNLIPKQSINLSKLKITAPTQIITLNYRQPTQTAKITIVEESPSPEIDTNSIPNVEKLLNTSSTGQFASFGHISESLELQINHNANDNLEIDHNLILNIPQETTEQINQTMSHESSAKTNNINSSDGFNENMDFIEDTQAIVTENIHIAEEPIQENQIMNKELIDTNGHAVTLENSIETTSSMKNTHIITEEIMNLTNNDQKILTADSNLHNIPQQIALNDNVEYIDSDGNIEVVDDARNIVSNADQSNITNTEEPIILKNNEQISVIENININNPPILTNESNKTSTTKSNIPKPIKITQNVKGKADKNTPKLLVSKVPIRRSSIKQYPAPAPPKSHFGNVQSGNVKQLQTRLFNAKPKGNTNKIDPIESKPSTSTMTKKKRAPPPPTSPPEATASAGTPISQLQTSPQTKKKNYFRETCRTEDEWTESDSEDSQKQVREPTEEQEQRPLSPPPPITLRRVSGQLIDLAKVRLPEGSPERQARMLLAEGATETWEQAQLAVELVIRGTEPSAALMAALECLDLESALVYLHQECELCASRLPEHEMVSMLRCTHRCCRECAHHYFTVQITERSIADCVCPYCKVPDLENLPEDSWLEYFAHLDILLKTLLETDVHELFQRKLRDRTLARDPNFRWCMECSSGFFVHPKQKKLRCPECRSISCASCRKPWTANHEGLTCDQYAAWIEDNDPERSVSAIQQHLRDNGLECPRCHFKYSLSRGGCMHFTCTQCKFEFCYGCGKPFTMGARCGLSEYCAKLGLHAHHPRNCLFYLRDKEPHELQTLLQMNSVEYETKPSEGNSGRCPVQLQRETPTGLVDGTCGSETPPNYAGLCKNHYLEYLSRLVRRREVDPLPILGVDDLETLVRRAAIRLPPRPYGSLEGLYKRALLEIVRDKIPLD